jgi:hypothetical protein
MQERHNGNIRSYCCFFRVAFRKREVFYISIPCLQYSRFRLFDRELDSFFKSVSSFDRIISQLYRNRYVPCFSIIHRVAI